MRSSVDWMTGGLTDFDEKGSKGNLFNPISGGKDKKWGVENEGPQYDTSRLNTTWGELGSKAKITGDYSVSGLLAKAKENKTPDVKPPVKPTTTIAYDQEMAAQQQAGIPGSGMELPSINAAAMISQAKITTLGISV